MSSFLTQLAILVVAGALLPAGARAQVAGAGGGAAVGNAPFHILIDCSPRKGPSPVFYLDGQRLDSMAVAKISPGDIQGISILPSDKAYLARLLGPEEGRRGVVFITTKAGEHTHAVRAFDRRLRKLEQAHPPANNPN